MTIDEYVQLYGERHRRMIADAIQFLDEREGSWNLPSPIDRNAYICGLIEDAESRPLDKIDG